MSPEENKATVLKLIKEIGEGNLAVIEEVCSPNFHFQSPNFPGWPRGLEGARQLVAVGPSLFADSKSVLEDIFAADDKVVVRWSTHGTYIGPVKIGFPNPGDKFAMGLISIYRFVDGKIEDDWGVQVCSSTDTAW